MKRYYRNKIILSILVVSTALILLRRSLSFFFDSEYSEIDTLISGSLKLIFLIWTITIIRRERLINWEYIFKNIILTSIISFLLIYISWSHFENKVHEFKSDISLVSHFVYIFSCLVTGFFEEFLFRILIFAYVTKLIATNAKYGYLKPILWTSFLFAIVHFTGFVSGYIDFLSVLNQVVFAFVIGIFFQSLLHKFQNIFLVAIIHAVINYNGMLSQRLFQIKSIEGNDSFLSALFQNLFAIGIIGVFIILPVAYYSLRNYKNEIVRID